MSNPHCRERTVEEMIEAGILNKYIYEDYVPGTASDRAHTHTHTHAHTHTHSLSLSHTHQSAGAVIQQLT
jgi:hypothetical protein